MSIEGASPGELHSFLHARSFGYHSNEFRYLDEAFLQPGLFLYAFRGFPVTSENDWDWRDLITEKRPEWEVQRMPELMRLRDYFSFMQFARDEQVIAVVCGASPAAGRWIGKPGIRCYGGRLLVPTSDRAPHDGLLAADPADAHLIEMLGKYDPPLSYAAYVRRLEAEGLRISSADTGFVLEDDRGNRFHDRYHLHGLYDAKGKMPVWVQPRAERLRAALNRHLGSDLILFGPHEEWEFRNSQQVAGPLWGPQAPAIEFSSNQEIRNRLTVDDLAFHFPYGGRESWNKVFPQHVIEKWS